MKRRKAIALAGAVTMTGASAALAISASLGSFGAGGPAQLVSHNTRTQKPVVESRTIDVPVPEATGGSDSAGTGGAPGTTPTTPPGDDQVHSAPASVPANAHVGEPEGDGGRETETPEPPHPEDSHPETSAPSAPSGD